MYQAITVFSPTGNGKKRRRSGWEGSLRQTRKRRIPVISKMATLSEELILKNWLARWIWIFAFISFLSLNKSAIVVFLATLVIRYAQKSGCGLYNGFYYSTKVPKIRPQVRLIPPFFSKSMSYEGAGCTRGFRYRKRKRLGWSLDLHIQFYIEIQAIILHRMNK